MKILTDHDRLLTRTLTMNPSCGSRYPQTRIRGKLTMSKHISDTDQVHNLCFAITTVCLSNAQRVWGPLHPARNIYFNVETYFLFLRKPVCKLNVSNSCETLKKIQTPWCRCFWMPAAARSAVTVVDPSEAAFKR